MQERSADRFANAFQLIADAYAAYSLPEDEGMWDMLCHPGGELVSIQEVLDHYEGSRENMPEPVARALELASDATYADGVQRIWSDRDHRYRKPARRRSPEEESRRAQEMAAFEAVNPEDAAFIRDLGEIRQPDSH
jgi:hypothetical protein